VRGGHHATVLPAMKSRDTRAVAWRGVSTVYISMVRKRRHVVEMARRAGVRTVTANTAHLSRDSRFPCKGGLYVQIRPR
jgi:hypothetical protein